MLLVFPLTRAKIVGTDIFHAALLLWVAGIGHLVAGNVDVRHDVVATDRLDPRRAADRAQFSVEVPDRGLRLGLALRC